MEITNTAFVHNAHSIQGPHRAMPAGESASAGQTTGIRDIINFSDEAMRLSRTDSASTASSKSGIRFDLVNRVRSEIAAGTYDTADKMDIALDRMVSNL
jgi:hypothetical protein